jgi:hypothetical protein
MIDDADILFTLWRDDIPEGTEIAVVGVPYNEYVFIRLDRDTDVDDIKGSTYGDNIEAIVEFKKVM